MGDDPENKEDSGDHGILALPQLSESKVLALPWKPKFLQGLLAPVLRSEAIADFRSKSVGGPPRIPDRAVTKDKGASLLPIVPIAEQPVVVSTRQLGRWPVKPPRLPRQPRSKARRLLALQDGSSQPAKPSPRPMSPRAVANALYLRDVLGAEPAIFRGDEIDGSVAGREEELLEFSRHRQDCQQAAQRQGRQQAARWRDRQSQKEALVQLCWILEECVPGRPESPPALDPSAFGKTLHVSEEDLILKTYLDDREDTDLDEMLTQDIAPPPSPELQQPEEDEENEDAGPRKKKKYRKKHSITKDMRKRLTGDLGPVTEEDSEEEMPRAKPLKERMKHALVGGNTIIDDLFGSDEAVAAVEDPAKMGKSDEPPENLDDGLSHPTSPATDVQDDVKLFAHKYLSNVTFKESADFQKIFEPYTIDDTIDQADLKAFLADLGLRPRNETERSALSQVLKNFNELEYTFQTVIADIIPPVRICLSELWMPRLVALFKDVNPDINGALTIQELDQILRRSGFSPGTSKVTETVLDVMPDSFAMFSNVKGEVLLDRPVVDLQRYAVLGPLLQERTLSHRYLRAQHICAVESLDAETQRLWGQYLLDVEFYHTRWSDKIIRKQRLLPVSALHKVALQTGLLNQRGPNFKQNLLTLAVDIYVRDSFGAEVPIDVDGGFHLSLRQVIQILSVVRKEECARALRIFTSADKHNSNCLSHRECLRCLHDCGMQTINRSETMLLRRLVDEFDLNGSGEIMLEEFLELLKFVSMRLRQAHRINAADKARRLGFTDEEGERIWETFLDADWSLNETLNQEELRTATQGIFVDFAWGKPISQEALERLLLDQGYMDQLRRCDVTIWDFMSILKSCKERVERPKIALKLGLESDLYANLLEKWEGLHPSANDTVPVKVVKQAMKKMLGKGVDSKLARLKDEKTDVVSFTLFLQIMSRTHENPTEPEEGKPKLHGDADRPYVRKLQFGSIEVIHDAARDAQGDTRFWHALERRALKN